MTKNKLGKWKERELKVPAFTLSPTPLSEEFTIEISYFCSKCGTMIPEAIFFGYKYCPYCGDEKE